MNQKQNNALSNMLLSLKKRYGISQTAIAKILGISVQALTDMKGGRRVFTPAMAEKLLEHYKNEPWIGWLVNELKDLAAPKENLLPSLPDSDVLPADTVVYNADIKPRPTIPLLKTPLLGVHSPEDEYCERYIELPEWATPLISIDSNPYVLEIATDDYSGRLRAGDCVLVLQIVIPNKEVMIVEQTGCLRLARNPLFANVAEKDTAGWIALDSGVMLKNATPVSTVAGIVMARM